MVKVDTLPSGFSGRQWTQQGRPVSEAYSRPSARLQLGMPAYDLHRLTEGPTLYLNGPPDVGIKSSLSTNVDHMHHGKFMMGQLSRDLTSAKVACHKSKVGPDPYNVNTSNPWHQRSSSLKFSVDGGESRSYRAPRPVCARSMNLDPYSVSSRDNSWANFGRTSTAAKAYRSAVSPSRQTSTAHGSARSASTYYFSPFPESLGVGSRAHTPRTPQGLATTAWTGAKTEPSLTGAKAWDMGDAILLSPGGTPATLPPLPAACRSSRM